MATTREHREEIARKRLTSVLSKHVIANARTLEQKISDAGPYGQRIDPHILTPVRNALVKEGALVRAYHERAPWFSLPNTPEDVLLSQLGKVLPVYRAMIDGGLAMRVGQALEIATYRALLEPQEFEFYGRFKNLEAHDDSQPYSKEEPSQHIGKLSLSGQQRLDFLIRHPTAGHLGLECKNVREWLYPDRPEIKEALQKCVALDCVPVLIARRIPYVSFMLLSTCGVIMHQCYNHIMPAADAELAELAKRKDLLGYHDIRLGNQPDARLQKFIQTNLPAIADEARKKFAVYKDLLGSFANGEMKYYEFAARVRRRSQGANEEHDWAEDEVPDWYRGSE